MIEPLEISTLQKLCVELGAVGAGSADYIENMIKIVTQEDSEEIEAVSDLPWCVCGVCCEMPTEDENKCCGRRTCITYQLFSKICLDRDVLQVVIQARADLGADEILFDNNEYRKCSYRQYTLWRYGKLGKGNRRVVPSCVVSVIRKTYPDAREQYMGFRAS